MYYSVISFQQTKFLTVWNMYHVSIVAYCMYNAHSGKVPWLDFHVRILHKFQCIINRFLFGNL